MGFSDTIAVINTSAIRIRPMTRVLYICISIPLFTVLFTACDTRKDYSADIEAIYHLLELRQKAVASKDLELYERIILPQYSDSGIDRNVLVQDMKLAFEKFPELSIELPRIRPDVKRSSARVMQTLVYRSGADRPAVNKQERLMFRRVDGHWFISAGIATGIAQQW